ncbi:hypothetical protein FSP39_020696 [Pinctada imbricata]|uniref:Uncharacterized protein n=1 Tax=Pinctada imbricata TaxID=66713 RepID=A0AA89C8C4_PINIB|nr:hypothetical protein FSP39_020696 [Pinctada imbricata]
MAVRRPSQTQMPSFCRRLTSSILILGLGAAFGVFIAYFSFSLRMMSPKVPLVLPKAVAPRATVHVPPPSRPGKSIKKDMSVQFREYVPKKIFLNVGGTMPLSVELFLDTYPHAQQYEIYSFLEDSSYDVYYAAYDNHTAISPVKVTGLDHSNDDASPSRSKGSKPVHFLDLALWITHNTKQDDYVMIKMDSEEEYDILDRFVSLAAIEWIDKYYTVKWNESIISEYENVLSAFSVKIQSWDEKNGTYSDFDEVNPTHVPPIGAGIKSTCISSENPFKFALFLFLSRISSQAIKTAENCEGHRS